MPNSRLSGAIPSAYLTEKAASVGGLFHLKIPVMYMRPAPCIHRRPGTLASFRVRPDVAAAMAADLAGEARFKVGQPALIAVQWPQR